MASFETGFVTITDNCKSKLKKHHKQLSKCLEKHRNCDFGKASEGTRINNLDNLPNKGMILSVYNINNNAVWIQTNKGHTRTTILLPTDL